MLGWDKSKPVPVYYFVRVKPTPKEELYKYLMIERGNAWGL